ncbi:GDSL-type esterase/lipase family protein [Bacillus sp. B15-48]|uniref:GDSL-type esterase/lipase family protein n=1 Tax=Bacillus sp. B15-48 TaxID=1548601 RepID=UPI00193EF272|nr:GDSL-type esterase/lipase family protein [Bacillus sp. B15-48]MBM4762686.1 hypothetical protein [Bacillus sp. B15-48]
MKGLKYLLICALILVVSVGGWIYSPQYQINKLKRESMAVGKDFSKETYLDYYRQSKKEDIYHLALGDSIIHGFGVGEKENFVYNFSNQLGEEINKTVHYNNKGKNGMTSTDLHKLIHDGVYDQEIANSDIITINIGGNDVLKTARKKDYYEAVKSFNTLQSTFTKNLTSTINKIKKINPNVTIVLLELYNPLPAEHQLARVAESLLSKWNIKIYEIAKETPSSLVVQTTKVINSKNQQNLSQDGVHPNPAGYAAITKQLLKQFSKEFRRQAV